MGIYLCVGEIVASIAQGFCKLPLAPALRSIGTAALLRRQSRSHTAQGGALSPCGAERKSESRTCATSSSKSSFAKKWLLPFFLHAQLSYPKSLLRSLVSTLTSPLLHMPVDFLLLQSQPCQKLWPLRDLVFEARLLLRTK